MEQAVAGDASGLRSAQTRHRREVEAAIAAATSCLRGSGHPGGDQAASRLSATLAAAIVEDAIASQLRAGVLDADQSAPGFGLDAASVPLASPAAPSRSGATRGGRTKEEGAGRQDARLQAEADRLAGRAQRLRAEAEEAEQQAGRARQAAEEAERQAGEARRAAEEAQRLARAARLAAEEA
jgi:hypothetical protein